MQEALDSLGLFFALFISFLLFIKLLRLRKNHNQQMRARAESLRARHDHIESALRNQWLRQLRKKGSGMLKGSSVIRIKFNELKDSNNPKLKQSVLSNPHSCYV